MAIFGRITARPRLRGAAQEPRTIPAFSSPIDCTPWVIGGLWPAELSRVTDETTTVAHYLRDDLQRIARSANNEVKIIRRAGMADPARQAEEARVIEQARARAVRRVESTLRHLQTMTAEAPARPASTPAAQDFAGTDIDKTQVIPAVRDLEPQEPPVAPPESTVRPDAAVVDSYEREPLQSTARHGASVVDGYQPGPAESTPLHDALVADSYQPEPRAARLAEPSYEIPAVAPEPAPQPPQAYPAREARLDAEPDSKRLQRLLAFVVRQEPRLNWAIGDYADGRTVLVSDLAHGWIPPGIALPAGVQLLAPERRAGKVATLLGDTMRVVTYAPGDSLNWAAEFAETRSSVQPRELPTVDDLGWELGQATHWRDGLPRMVHTLAKAAAAGTGVVDDEVDLLRVHLDTAYQQLLAQHPDVDPALLLNCQLLAAIEGIVTGDPTSANYHLSWFQKLNAPPASQWETRSRR